MDILETVVDILGAVTNIPEAVMDFLGLTRISSGLGCLNLLPIPPPQPATRRYHWSPL